jgi:hypothetical protein
MKRPVFYVVLLHGILGILHNNLYLDILKFFMNILTT